MLNYCDLQLSIADRYFELEKATSGINQTNSLSALSKKCVEAAKSEPELLVKMAEFVNRNPHLSDSQAERVKTAMQSMGLAE
jgi:hypothetical protein